MTKGAGQWGIVDQYDQLKSHSQRETGRKSQDNKTLKAFP